MNSAISISEPPLETERAGTAASPRHAIMLLLLAITLVCAVPSAYFASRQTIWIDETTQLSGLTLSPVQVVPWLLGHDSYRFAVPGDRMPPMSYWIGWTWGKCFGSSEWSLRAAWEWSLPRRLPRW